MSNKDINDRVDMAQLLLDIGFSDVDPEADEQLLFCIFHNDSGTKSFSVNLTKKVFHCFSSACGVRGSAVTLYALWKQIPYERAQQELQFLPKRRSLLKLQQQLSKSRPAMSVSKRLEVLTEFTKAMPRLIDSPLADVLTSRGITRDTIDRYDLRAYVPERAEKLDPEVLFLSGLANVWRRPVYGGHPVLFPFYLGKSVTFLQGRQAANDPTRSKYIGCRGSVPCLFNHGALMAKPARVFITEGVIDALSMEQMGYYPAVGIVGTEGFKPDWAADFKGVKEVWLATDNDAAGDAAAQNLMALIAGSGCSVGRFMFDRRFKDVNEALIAGWKR